MSMTDPVADYLTRIRNGQSKLKKFVDIPCSNIKKRISYILKEEHFVRDFIEIKDNKQNMLRVFLKYDFENEPVIHGIKRISKPGCRVYAASDKLPRVLNGLGISILTTSKGIISNKKAKQLSVGGEVLCHVW